MRSSSGKELRPDLLQALRRFALPLLDLRQLAALRTLNRCDFEWPSSSISFLN